MRELEYFECSRDEHTFKFSHAPERREARGPSTVDRMKIRKKRANCGISWITRDMEVHRAWKHRCDCRKPTPRQKIFVKAPHSTRTLQSVRTFKIPMLQCQECVTRHHPDAPRPRTERDELATENFYTVVLADSANRRMAVKHLLKQRGS
jgi:hypothetical protein